MPALQFKGRVAIEGYHHSVPHHVMEIAPKLSLVSKGESPSFDGNLLIEGDNLVALKALLPTHAGRVDCIYIDPPYNTGKEGWIYNDNLNQPQFKEWFGKVVGKEGEDATRHDKWCCMMYPRLKLLQELLADDGVIFISIDDNEMHNLRTLMGEIFGESNFVGSLIWKGATDNNPTLVAVEHEYIFCWAKDKRKLPSEWANPNPAAKEFMLTEYDRLRKQHESLEDLQKAFRKFIKENREKCEPLTHYDRVDKDGPYTGSRKVHNPGKQGYFYDIRHPVTKKVCKVPARGYRYPEQRMRALIASGKILYGETEEQIVQIKEYLKDYHGALKSVIELDSRTGANVLEAIFGNRETFKSPKPVELLKQLLTFSTDKQAIILDSFAGSGTTAHAVLELNKEDGGNRQFILVQIPYDSASDQKAKKNISEAVTSERIRRVITGYSATKKDRKGQTREENVEGLGGAFSYVKIGAPLFSNYRSFDGDGPGYVELAKYLFYTETSHDYDSKQADFTTGQIGTMGDTAYYLLYKQGDKGQTAVDAKWLEKTAERQAAKKLVIYCEKIWLHKDEIKRIESKTDKNIRVAVLPHQLR